jgi:hypothetical protein
LEPGRPRPGLTGPRSGRLQKKDSEQKEAKGEQARTPSRRNRYRFRSRAPRARSGRIPTCQFFSQDGTVTGSAPKILYAPSVLEISHPDV